MKPRIFGLENEYGLIFSPNGRIYLPIEKILGYIFEGLIPNSWPSNAFLVNGARFYQDTGCHPEYSTPECHIIEGDSNMSEIATYLKVGTAALVLSMIEDGYTVSHMELDDPVKAIREVARDTTLKRKIKLEDGRELTAIEIQRVYLERAMEYLWSTEEDRVEADVVRRWASVLDRLEEDPMQLCH